MKGVGISIAGRGSGRQEQGSAWEGKADAAGTERAGVPAGREPWKSLHSPGVSWCVLSVS